MRLIVRLQGFDGHGGEGDGAPARFRLGLLELQFALRALHDLIDGQLTALQSASDQRNPSSSPRRTPVVTATSTDWCPLPSLFNSVAIGSFPKRIAAIPFLLDATRISPNVHSPTAKRISSLAPPARYCVGVMPSILLDFS